MRRSWLGLTLGLAYWTGCHGAVQDAAFGSDAGAKPERDAAIETRTRDAGPLLIPVIPFGAAAGRPAPARDAAADASADASVDAAKEPSQPSAAIMFEPGGRGFSGRLELRLSPGQPGDMLRFTVDGSLPTLNSPAYDKPIPITATTWVRAIAVRNMLVTPVVNHTYLQLADDTKSFSSNLPVLVIHTLGGAAPKADSHEYVPATLALFEPSGARTLLDGTATLSSRLGIKVRGRSTRVLPKKSYTIELWGADEEDAPAPLLGMPSDGDWVLYAPYTYDRSMMRNAFAYALSNQIGRYAPRTRFCELFVVAGSGAVTQQAYAGVYSLTERLTRGKDRIAIQKLGGTDRSEPALSGGYVFQVNEPDEPAEVFMAAGQRFLYVDPDADEIIPEQTKYLSDYLNGWQRAVAATDGKDPMSGKPYTELMDSAAFIDHHILNMLAKNPDAFALSAYFHKDRGSALRAGPIWDFDVSMGAQDPWGDRSSDPTHWGPASTDVIFTRAHYKPLFAHAEFAQAYWARWDELLASKFTSAEFHKLLDGWKAQLQEAELRNRARWPESAPRNSSFEAEVSALQGWLDQRLMWIQQHRGELPN